MYAWSAVVWAALLAAPAGGVAAAPGIAIATGQGTVEVRAGHATWTLSTTAFDVVHAAAVDGAPRLGPGRAGVRALGKDLAFGPPSAVTHGADWVELRGWVDAPSHLWYVARYQFYADHPLARLVLTLTDRHDTSPAPELSDAYWKGRELSGFSVELGARGGVPATVTQHNSWSASAVGAPWVDVVSASGAPYQWSAPDPTLIKTGGQISHAVGSDANQVVWHPMFEGRAHLAALVAGFTGGASYRAAKTVTYEVVDAQGQTHAVTADQRTARIDLGSWPLAKGSVVRLEATGSGQETAIAGTLVVVPEDRRPPFEIPLGVRSEGALASGPVTLVVKDFWQHHPISLVRTPEALGWRAIEAPAEYTGGMGLTIESMIALDGPAQVATDVLYAPPPRALPPRVHPVDGSLAHGPAGTRFDAMVREFVPRYAAELDRMDDFGWRNWGDYQIGNSYVDKKTGAPVEDWANLQYDLPTGLLVAWLRTGDPRLWRWAQASVRHLMDMDLVKFHPFMDKLDGLVYRKGEMPRARSHIGAEPIVDQGFAWRSLLLYYSLTGEEWARDLAKQNIDRLVYYATTRPNFVLEGGRPAAWMLRGALAGAEWFPGDAHYQKTADEIVRLLVGYFGEHHRLPGRQPVWEGQIVEGLAEYHRRTGRADVAAVIVGEMRHLLHDGVRTRPDGGFDLRYCYEEKNCGGKAWTDEENYVFLWLSSLAYAGAISHDPRFGQWADALFAYGEKRLAKRRDVRGWTSVLGFPHLYVELSGSGKSLAKN